MQSSELRAEARKSLTGKWGKAALITLVYSLIMFAARLVLNLIPIVGPIVDIVISIPITYGIIISFIKLKRGEEVSYTEFLSNGFEAFGKSWGVVGNTLLKLIIPLVVLIISIFILFFGAGASIFSAIASTSEYASNGLITATAGFGALTCIGLFGYIASLIWLTVKGYYYSLSYYVLYDNPNMTSKEAVEESERLMKNNRWNYFWLGLTFIGWTILSAFTLYIGMLWLIPYIMVAQIAFYEDRAGILNKEKTDKTEVIE